MIDFEDLNYQLPRELIAQYPAERREESRLMILKRKQGLIEHLKFKEIPEILNSSYVLIFNKSRVIPARIFGYKETGGKVEVLFLNKPCSGINHVLIRGKLRAGQRIIFSQEIVAKYLGRREDGVKFIELNYAQEKIIEFLKRKGVIPLPPYIKREVEDKDYERYQTVYAEKDGSIAAPTAGLHFSQEILNKLKAKGIEFGWVILHVSYASFKPIKEKDLKATKLYPEYYEFPESTAELIKLAHQHGKMIIAVGTTTCRVLETVAQKGVLKGCSAYTELFIKPPFKFLLTDCLLTNFHLPHSSLLLLVSAFAGKRLIQKAYEEAIRRKYRFYSYGDCMLIL